MGFTASFVFTKKKPLQFKFRDIFEIGKISQFFFILSSAVLFYFFMNVESEQISDNNNNNNNLYFAPIDRVILVLVDGKQTVIKPFIVPSFC